METKTYERALVFAARNGNETSFEELYKLYHQKIFALARMTVKNDADAEDILQQTFISAWQNIGKLTDIDAFNTWLQRICLNHCYSLLRKRRDEAPLLEEVEADDAQSVDSELSSDLMLPDVYAEKADLKDRLGRIIDELSNVQRQTLTLYYFSGLSVEEISEVMEVSEGTVKSRLFLARKAIRIEIEEQERKSGQKFYGVGIPLVPFALLFKQKVEAVSLSADTAAGIFKLVAQTVTGKAMTGGTASKAAAKSALKASAKHIGKGVLSRAAAAVLAVSIMAGGTAGAVSQASAVESFSIPSIPGTGTPGFGSPDPGGSWIAGQDENKQLNLAYEAYLDLLLDRREYIDSYDFQRIYPINDLTRAVAFSDITGDGVPELIYMEGKDNGYGYMECAILNIVTAADGEITTLFSSDGWDVQAGGGHHYYLFRQKGDDRLYVYTSSGDERWTYTYYVLDTGFDGRMKLDELCRRDTSYDYTSGAGATVNAYFVDGQEVTEKAYNERVKKLEDKTSEVLIYSDGVPTFINDFVSQNNCPAMTCAEAIAYLRGLIGEKTLQNEKTDIDINTLPASLTAFLNQFNAWYRDAAGTWENDLAKEYDCEHAADGASNILASIVNQVTPSCVDFSLYPGVMPEDHFGQIDPRGWSTRNWYVVYDGPTVDWVAKNIFNVTDREISALLTQGESQRWFYREATSDGGYQYYAPIAGGVGDPMTEVRLRSVEFDGKKYYVSYDVYFVGWLYLSPPMDAELRGSYYAELEYKTVDGRAYWSMYKNAPEPNKFADRPAAGTPAEDIFSKMPPIYNLAGTAGAWYSELRVEPDGSFTGYYQDADIGDTGEGYSGTVYYSEYTGSFQNPMKLNDYTYSFEVGPIDFKGTDGEVTMSDEYSADGVNPIRNVFIETATLSEGETVYLYTPGAKLSELPEGFKYWVHPSDGEKTLSVFGLYGTKYEYGFLGSFDNVEPAVRKVKFDNEREVDLNWGWGLFDRDAYEYSHDLAMAALILSKAAEMGMSDAEERLSSLGFENMSSKWYDFADGDQNNPGITFASRAVTLNGETTVIAAIVVRGSADLPDWGTNLNSPFNGFFPAGHNVAEEFKKYYNGLDEYYGIDVSNDNTVLFITGHSQGGAVAGQLAKMLEIICARRERIFDYTFASPKYETFSDDTDLYGNVHNIINIYDMVPLVPLGYKRYGHDWFYASNQYSDEQAALYGMWAYLLDVTFNIAHEHDLLTYLACMVSDTPSNMGEGAVNTYSVSSIHCPVDIRVCGPDGTLMAWTEGESVFYGDDPKALVMTDGDEKYVVASGEVEYTIVFEGTGKGTMDYEQQTLDGYTNEILSETTYAGVPVREGISYAVSVSNGDAGESDLYEVNGSGRAVNRVSESGKMTRVVFKSGLWGWLSVACATLGALILLIDIACIVKAAGRQKRRRRDVG